MQARSPFMYGRIVDDPHFINRTEELQRLKTTFTSGVNTVIISARRWGKSSLVHKVSRDLSDKNFIICQLDLFNIRTEKEFYEVYIREVLKSTSSNWQQWVDNGKQFLKGIIPKFSMGADPYQEFSVSLELNDNSKSVTEILELPENIAVAKKKNIIVCIDEFQNLSNYEDPLAFQKKLRSVWQTHKQTSYCLYGSKRHMVSDLFENKSMPFYKFGDILFLEKIKREHWVEYILKSFKKTKKKITKESASMIADLMKDHPYYVQQLAQKVWVSTIEDATQATIVDAVDQLLHENSILFLREIENLSNTQINFLKAICDNVQQLSSAETLKKYNLGTSANVLRIKDALEQKEVLDFMEQYPVFIDPVFELWMKQIYFKK